jgi:hypothetical protein
LDLDAARLGLFAPVCSDAEHAISVLGRDVRRISVLG